ncbi:MAG: MarR family transcriptional regulator [bacterium]
MNELQNIIALLSREIVELEESAKEQFSFNELTLTQMHYLETINQQQNPNLTELALEMGLTKPSVTVAIDKLIEKEYVYKVKSDEDRRSMHLHLTEKGKLLNQMHDYAHKLLAERMISVFDDDELTVLKQLLKKYLNRK